MIDRGTFLNKALYELSVIALTALCIIAALVAFERYSPGRGASGGVTQRSISVGTKVKLRSVDFQAHSMALILVTSPTCIHCLRSAMFHRDLSELTKRLGVPFYVVVPDRKASAQYVQKTGFLDSSIREYRDLDSRVAGTPTILAVDSAGVVHRVWIGELTVDAQEAVREVVRNPSKLDAIKETISGTVRRTSVDVKNYTLQQINQLRQTEHVQLIDIHEREEEVVHQPGAIVIPLLELPVREFFELDRSRLQVIDCATLPEANCRKAAAVLVASGFKTATFGAGALERFCGVENIN